MTKQQTPKSVVRLLPNGPSLEHPPVKSLIRILAFFCCVGITVAAIGWLMRTNQVANEVITGALGLLASIFTTPFILEASLALMGLVIVLTYNQYRRDCDDKDEWVLMPKTEAPETKAKTES